MSTARLLVRVKTPTLAVKQTKDKQPFLFRLVTTGLILLIYGFFLAHPINLTVGDLGRHLRNGRAQVKGLTIVLLLTVAASCLNPAGLFGAIYPFLILKEYEFPVIENYSVRSVLKEGFEFLPLIYFEIVFGLLCGSSTFPVRLSHPLLHAGLSRRFRLIPFFCSYSSPCPVSANSHALR